MKELGSAGRGRIPQEGRKEAWALAECQSQESTQRDPGGARPESGSLGCAGNFKRSSRSRSMKSPEWQYEESSKIPSARDLG